MREHAHDHASIKRRLANGPSLSYLRDFIYGGIDGAVTTFALVAGVVGAELSIKTILILGAANLVADGFSMAASNFAGTRTEHDERASLEAYERRQVRTIPEGEREEVRQILIGKGFTGSALEHALDAYTECEDRWVEFMLQEEYGLPASLREPWPAALATLSAFVLCGAVPLVPYVLGLGRPFLLASVLTGLTFFAIGSAKAKWSEQAWWRLGLETFFIGGIAAVMAYLVGVMLA